MSSVSFKLDVLVINHTKYYKTFYNAKNISRAKATVLREKSR